MILDMANPVLPNRTELFTALNLSGYDGEPWNETSHNPPTFRNTFEGWKRVGCQLHNSVHLWVGGQMRVVSISPNDPVFWLHHTFVDKVWDMWQHKYGRQAFRGYLPFSGAKPGHNLADIMQPFEKSILDVLWTERLGYRYDRDALDLAWEKSQIKINK